MRNIFYRYNPKTLSYERVYPTRTKRFLAFCRQLLVSIAVGGSLLLAYLFYFDSPQELLLKKENKLLQTQYQILSKRIVENEKVLEDLQRRDDDLYRALFNAEPVSESARKLGVGGSNRYEDLLNMPYADMVIETTYKLDKLTRQLYAQSNSYDEIVSWVNMKDERSKCMPAIQPIKSEDLKRIGSGFGNRLHPVYGVTRFHSGIDLNAKVGTPIYATGDGVVESANFNGGYGNCVVVDHGFGYKTVYAHNQKNLVKKGDKVSRGQQVATVGMTGTTTGPHCHYEVRVNNKPDNPAKYFFSDLSPEEFSEMMYISEFQ